MSEPQSDANLNIQTRHPLFTDMLPVVVLELRSRNFYQKETIKDKIVMNLAVANVNCHP